MITNDVQIFLAHTIEEHLFTLIRQESSILKLFHRFWFCIEEENEEHTLCLKCLDSHIFRTTIIHFVQRVRALTRTSRTGRPSREVG